jgi:pimeloyl-ACP methyl ester carboxylesterase
VSRSQARKALLAGGALLGAVVTTVAAERYLVSRARSVPDPDPREWLAERPGEERRVASFDGTELAVNVIGPEEAPRLVFAHGFSLDMTAWHYQWKRFSDARRCILYDHRGHGRSGPAAGGDYSLEALGRDLRAVLDSEAGDGPVVLIGHSMGGMATLSLAALHPEEFGDRVVRVVLADTGASNLLPEIVGGLGTRAAAAVEAAFRRLAAKPERAYRLRSRAFAGRKDLAFLIARSLNFGPEAPPSLVDHLVAIAARAPLEVWTDLAVSMMQMDLGHALEHIRVPALVMVGELDRLTPPNSARAMVARLPEARLVVIEGVGHCAMLEAHDRFNDELSRFLHEVAS